MKKCLQGIETDLSTLVQACSKISFIGDYERKKGKNCMLASDHASFVKSQTVVIASTGATKKHFKELTKQGFRLHYLLACYS